MNGYRKQKKEAGHTHFFSRYNNTLCPNMMPKMPAFVNQTGAWWEGLKLGQAFPSL